MAATTREMPAPALAEKTCVSCMDSKPYSEFGPSKQTSDGFAVYCRPCRRAKNRGYYQRWTNEQRQKHRQRVLRYRYGIDYDDLIALYGQQGAACAICREPGDRPALNERRPGGARAGTLVVDHDHDTQQVRGLLCIECNLVLGYVGDDADRLRSAIAYLERS